MDSASLVSYQAYIEIRGGGLVAAYSDDPNLELTVLDWDEIAETQIPSCHTIPVASVAKMPYETRSQFLNKSSPKFDTPPTSGHTNLDAAPEYRFATLLNDDGHADGYFHSPTGLTQHQWEGIAEDLECAWGVYFNDCNVCLPVEEIGLPTDEEREYSGGWWAARTRESINAFRLGVPAFFCYIAKEHGESIQPLGHLPPGSQGSSVEIRWI